MGLRCAQRTAADDYRNASRCRGVRDAWPHGVLKEEQQSVALQKQKKKADGPRSGAKHHSKYGNTASNSKSQQQISKYASRYKKHNNKYKNMPTNMNMNINGTENGKGMYLMIITYLSLIGQAACQLTDSHNYSYSKGTSLGISGASKG